jgi:hypothetical protein
MSDHDSEISPTRQTDSGSASFSTNGNDPGGFVSEDADGGQFLAELAKAMQTTAQAEQTRNAEETEQRRQSHIDAIRAREAIEAEELRELAKEDVKGIDAWSDGEIKRIKLERERRIAARREQLQVRLEEHRTVVGREVEAVEASVGAYRADIAEYFRRLESETDPVAIARYAGTRPPFPDLTKIGPGDMPGRTESRPVGAEPQAAPPPAQAAPEVIQAAEVEPPAEPVAESQDADTSQDQDLIGVVGSEGTGESTDQSSDHDDAVATDQSDEAVPVALQEEPPAGEGATGSEGSEGRPEEEPVGAVVMPRSTGAGSWLRWPNNSGSDPEN